MSITTLPPAAQGDADDFGAWEAELAQPKRRPSKAAQRRAAREACDRGFGINRHRKHEREV